MMNSRRKTQWNLDWLDRNEYESDKHTPHDFDKLVDSVMGQDSGISESDVFISEFSSDDVNDLKNVFGSFNSDKLNYDLIENTNKLQDAKIKNFTNYNLAIFMFDTNLN